MYQLIYGLLKGEHLHHLPNLDPGNVSFTGIGLHTITLTATNECGSTRATQQFSISDVTSSDAGPPQNLCGSIITMAGNTPLIGSGVWSYVSGPSGYFITTPSSPATTIMGLVPGTYVFRWTITNAGCISSSDVTITISSGATPANAGPDQNLCLAASTTMNANTPLIGTGAWSYVSGPTGSVITTPSSPNTTITGLIPGSYVFRWSTTFSTCTPSIDDVNIIVTDNPTTSNAGTDQTICSSDATLSGNTPIIGTGLWTLTSGPNTSVITNITSPSTSVTGLIAGTYIFKWTITSGTCSPSVDEVQVNVTQGPSTAYAGADQAICVTSTATLSAAVPVIGTGQWTFASGPTTPVIVRPLSATTAVTSLITGDYIFRWSVSNGVCAPSTDDVKVTINENSTIANAGPLQNLCGESTTLAANTPVIGTGEWSQFSGPDSASISTPSSPTTTITGLNPGTYIFQWKITNGSCSNSSNDTVVVSPGPTTAQAGNDQTVCATNSITLTGNTPLSGSGIWSLSSGPNTVTIVSASSETTTVTGIIPGTYIFRWSISNGICTPSTDDVQVSVLNDLQNQISNTPITICSGQVITVTGFTPSGGNGSYIYQWQQSIDGNNWVDIPSANGQNYSGILNTSVYLRRKITSLPCESFSNTVFITVQAGVTNNNISKDQDVCINTIPSLITGSVPGGGDGIYTYQWQQSTDNGLNWTNISSATNKDFAPGILAVTTSYRRTVETNLCKGPKANTSNVVALTIHENAKAEFSFSVYAGCSPFIIDNSIITATAYSDRNGTYTWYANNIVIGQGIIFPGDTIINDNESVIIKLKVLSQYGCVADSMEHIFFTAEKPAPSFNVSDSANCGPLTVNFENTTPGSSNFNFSWNFGNGQTSAEIDPGSVVFQPSPYYTDTIYTVTLTSFTSCDTVVYAKHILVKSKPKALFSPVKSRDCSPFRAEFSNTSKGNRTTFIWDFGDGSNGLTTNVDSTVHHTFYTGVQDTFYVKLIAFNECGYDTSQYAIVVTPNQVKLDFAVNGNQVSGCAPHTVNFINNTSGATSFNWDFGDGNTKDTYKNIDTVTHTYNTAGTYTVTLTARGCSDTTTTETIQVFNKPVVAFSAMPLQACLGDTISFSNKTDTATSLSWNFGDGYNSSLTNPTHNYTKAGCI